MIVRALVRRAKLSIDSIGRMTLTQAMLVLSDDDPSDPHYGNESVFSDDQFLEWIEEWKGL